MLSYASTNNHYTSTWDEEAHTRSVTPLRTGLCSTSHLNIFYENLPKPIRGPYVSKLKQQPALIHEVCHKAQHAVQRQLNDAEGNAIAQIVVQSHRDRNLAASAISGAGYLSAAALTYRVWRPFIKNRTGALPSIPVFSIKAPASLLRTALRFGLLGYGAAVLSLPLSTLYSERKLRASMESDSRLRDWNTEANRTRGGQCDAA